MRKSLFLTLFLSLCVVDSGAFAATSSRGNARGSQVSAPVATRSVSRQKVTAAGSNGSGTARVASRQVAATPIVSVLSNNSVTARAATQKALNMGTKVAVATENTVIDEACQNAYYGCMDAFCMLDNASGGRCQCSDKIVDLNVALDEIMRLDEQSMLIATEGVEKVQMGEYADQINSRAKSIEAGLGSSKSTGQKDSSTDISRKIIDLSAWSNAGIFDNEVVVDNIFVDETEDFSNKTGDDLQRSANKICVAQIPEECKKSSTLLQMAYVQKVRSDCIGYENALKQQKTASQQKLLTAQKAVRDAVLTEVREQNKYSTTGECAIAFAQCMQTTAECGNDYTGCVTLAAAENVKNNKAGSKAAQTTIKGVVSGADITLAATTMEQLLAKKEICASVTRQCINSNRNDAVWNLFLRNAAPALKSAELIAEQNLRSNCIPSLAECFKTACKSQFLDDDESYDMCLSSPSTYKSLCKVQLEPCLEATGGTYDKPEASLLWNGLVAMLNSMKVDACTKEIKTCLTDRCGADYAGCIGLDTYSIGKICPVDKLTACVTDGRFAKRNADGTVDNEDEIREYIAQIAQGLALQIDNSLASACQRAADEAMIKVCGDTESCDAAGLDLSTVKALMKVQACTLRRHLKDGNTVDEELRYCLPDIAQFTDDEVYSLGYGSQTTADAKLIRETDAGGNLGYGVYATLLNKPDISNILFGPEVEGDSDSVIRFLSQRVASSITDNGAMNIVDDFSQQSTDMTVAILQGALDRMMGQLDSDPTVVYCKTGREVQGFKDREKFGRKGIENARFPGLTDKYRYIIADSLLSKLQEKNSELIEDFDVDVETLNNKITERVAEIARKRGEAVEEAVDLQNTATCHARRRNYIGSGYKKAWTKQVTNTEADYNGETNVCTIRKVLYTCTDWHTPWFRSDYCSQFDSGTEKSREELQMPKFQ